MIPALFFDWQAAAVPVDAGAGPVPPDRQIASVPDKGVNGNAVGSDASNPRLSLQL